MFTIECRVNGALVAAIYGHNEGDLDERKGMAQPCRYRYILHAMDSPTTVAGNVEHDRMKGLLDLLAIILQDAKH